MVTGGGQPGPFGINTAISRLQRTPRELIMKPGLVPDPAGHTGSRHSWRQNALDPGFHCVRTHGLDRGPLRQTDALDPGFHGARTRWIRGFMAFQLARRTRTVVRMVPG
jgi:hypothetical protein